MKRSMGVYLAALIWILACTSVPLFGQRLDPAWPTPNPAYFEGKSKAEYIQPTASGELESGLFGCVRTGGRQFHEGIDLKPISRDRAGEARDAVFVILPGVVRHVSRIAGNSSYGRYVVVEHTDVSPSIVSLYAHLASIEPGLSAGDVVKQGQALGIMGRSASGYAIPRDRAHLHLEMGVWLSRGFQSWYNWKKFGSKNDHGLWNGMNILGFDPLDFYDQLRSRQVDDLQQYFSRMKPAVRVRISTKIIPDFIERYPTLRKKDFPAPDQFGGWEILFSEMGLPISWTPLTAMELVQVRPGEIRVEPVEEGARLPRCKSLLFRKAGRYAIGSDLEVALQLLFGLRKEL